MGGTFKSLLRTGGIELRLRVCVDGSLLRGVELEGGFSVIAFSRIVMTGVGFRV